MLWPWKVVRESLRVEWNLETAGSPTHEPARWDTGRRIEDECPYGIPRFNRKPLFCELSRMSEIRERKRAFDLQKIRATFPESRRLEVARGRVLVRFDRTMRISGASEALHSYASVLSRDTTLRCGRMPRQSAHLLERRPRNTAPHEQRHGLALTSPNKTRFVQISRIGNCFGGMTMHEVDLSIAEPQDSLIL